MHAAIRAHRHGTVVMHHAAASCGISVLGDCVQDASSALRSHDEKLVRPALPDVSVRSVVLDSQSASTNSTLSAADLSLQSVH